MLKLCRNLHLDAMRTTLDINDSLLAKAKAVAAQEHISLTRLIEEGLVLRLRQPAGPPPRHPTAAASLCRERWIDSVCDRPHD